MKTVVLSHASNFGDCEKITIVTWKRFGYCEIQTQALAKTNIQSNGDHPNRERFEEKKRSSKESSQCSRNSGHKTSAQKKDHQRSRVSLLFLRLFLSRMMILCGDCFGIVRVRLGIITFLLCCKPLSGYTHFGFSLYISLCS